MFWACWEARGDSRSRKEGIMTRITSTPK